MNQGPFKFPAPPRGKRQSWSGKTCAWIEVKGICTVNEQKSKIQLTTSIMTPNTEVFFLICLGERMDSLPARIITDLTEWLPVDTEDRVYGKIHQGDPADPFVLMTPWDYEDIRNAAAEYLVEKSVE